MDYNEHNKEAEALFATKRKQQQAEEAERKRLEELEQKKKQMAEEVKRLEALQAAQREQEAQRAWEAQQAQQAQWAQQTYGGPGTGANPAGGKNGPDPKKKKIILISVLAGVAVVLLAVFLILILGSKSKPTDEPTDGQRNEPNSSQQEGPGTSQRDEPGSSQKDEPSEATTEDWGEDVTPFYGMWQYDEYEFRVGINGDGTWSVYDGEGSELNSGAYYWEDGWLMLEDAAGDKVYSLSLGSDDRLYDSDGDALSPWSEGPYEDWNEDLTPFYGTWKYDDYDIRFEINEDGTWSMYDAEFDEHDGGTFYWENGWLILEESVGDLAWYLSLGTDDRLYDDQGYSLSRYVEDSTENWSENPELQYFNGHYYQFFDMDTSWSEARDYCIQQGGHLVTVTSPEEQAFLTECYLYINGSDVGPWLGAYSNGAFGGSKNDWRWVTDEDWDYSNWEAGEPSNSHGTEWYAHFWKQMQWNDVADNDPRNSQHGFICEYDDLADEAVANGFG